MLDEPSKYNCAPGSVGCDTVHILFWAAPPAPALKFKSCGIPGCECLLDLDELNLNTAGIVVVGLLVFLDV